jgi:hypothetical protein
MMERDDETAHNDPTLASNPVDPGDSPARSGGLPPRRPEDGPTASVDPALVARHQAAPSPSPGDDPGSGRAQAAAVDAGGTDLSDGNGAGRQDLPPGSSDNGDAPSPDQGVLLPEDQRQRFTAQWSDIQARFVDEPRQSVERADALIVDIMQRVTAGFSQERERLEAQWEQGESVSTEDLRVALTRYRSLLNRLISA